MKTPYPQLSREALAELNDLVKNQQGVISHILQLEYERYLLLEGHHKFSGDPMFREAAAYQIAQLERGRRTLASQLQVLKDVRSVQSRLNSPGHRAFALVDLAFEDSRAQEILGDLKRRDIAYVEEYGRFVGRFVTYSHLLSILAYELVEKLWRFVQGCFQAADWILTKAIALGERVLHAKHIYAKLAIGGMALELLRRLFAKLLEWIG